MVENAKKPKHNYTEGNVLGNIIKMGFPSAIGFAAGNLYQIADMFWVSRLGAGAVAAVTFFSTYYWVISSVNMIAGTGSIAVISRRYGENDLPRTEVAIKEALVLKLVLAGIFGIIGFITTPVIVRLLGAQGDVAAMCIPYGRILFAGLMTNFTCWTIYTALRGIGHPNTAMGIMIGSFALNMILDPFFIFGWWIFPEMGVTGAAVASIISYTLTFAFGVALFCSGRLNVSFHLRPKASMHFRTMWQMMKIGIPSGATSISDALGRMVVMPILAVFGSSAVAVYGAGMQVLHMGIMLCVGLELGLGALIGQNMGAGKLDRAWSTAKQGLWLGFGTMVVFGAATYVFAEPLIRIFFDGAEEVSLGILFYHILAISLPFYGVYLVFEGIFTGSGDTVPLMTVGVAQMWAVQVPAAFLLTRYFDLGPAGVWWAMIGSALTGAGLFFILFMRKKWLYREV